MKHIDVIENVIKVRKWVTSKEWADRVFGINNQSQESNKWEEEGN